MRTPRTFAQAGRNSIAAIVDYETFTRAAELRWEEIPDVYREGVDGLTLSEEVRTHPDHPTVFTMGECITEHYPSAWDGPATLRSVVVLYHGSFAALASGAPDFDWEGEIWETLTHELRHHLEALAAEDGLEGVDYAVEHDYRRSQGDDFDPWYFQHAEEVEPGVFVAEGLVFLELEWSGPAPPEFASFELDTDSFEVPLPRRVGDVHFLTVTGLPDDAAQVDVVLVRQDSRLKRLGRVLGRSALRTTSSRARAKKR